MNEGKLLEIVHLLTKGIQSAGALIPSGHQLAALGEAAERMVMEIKDELNPPAEPPAEEPIAEKEDGSAEAPPVEEPQPDHTEYSQP
jgi:hypothetical protein